MAARLPPTDPSQGTLPQPTLALVYPACVGLPLIYASTSQEMHRLAVLVHSFLLVGRAGGAGTIVIGVFTVRGGGMEISQEPSLQGSTGSWGNILCTLSISLSPSNSLVRIGEAGGMTSSLLY